MIFISHNFNDKPIVEPIAVKLADVFGTDKVFYDSWSMQPGDGIIDKMDEGLRNCEFFFFFVSKRSLASNMVKLEWQNALYKATQNKVKLIPVKLDDCFMPDILIQAMYIDIYGKGFEYGLRQIIDVINNKNTFIQNHKTYENVRAYILSTLNTTKLQIEIRAETYVEPISKYIFLVDNTEDQVDVECTNAVTMRHVFMKDVNYERDLKCNGVFFHVVSPTAPGFPFRFSIGNKTDAPIEFVGILRATGENTARLIPIIMP